MRDDELIHEEYKRNPSPFWIWLIATLLFVSVLWTLQSTLQRHITSNILHNPFLQVTNREMSLFLWQNPQHMRVNAARKSGYLPGFQYLDKVTPEVDMADEIAIAPPGLLFLYHTWSRQIRNEIPIRPIDPKTFQEFLGYAEEWKPENWPLAPKGYVDLIPALDYTAEKDLRALPDDIFPYSVRLAFQGWKNFFKEGDAINKSVATVEEVKWFLELYPHYSRSYWRNIVSENYLKIFLEDHPDPKMVVPTDQLAPFLRVSLYNAKKVVL